MGFPLEGLQTFVLSIYRGYWFRKAQMLVVETEYVRQGYWRRVGMPLARIAVVANTCGQHYLDRQGIRPFPAAGSRIRILCFAAPHKHKRVDIVPQVAKELIARHRSRLRVRHNHQRRRLRAEGDREVRPGAGRRVADQ